MAVEPTARSSPISLAGGNELVAAPAIPGGSPKPKRRATETSRLAPSLAPSGAKTLLHDSANDWNSVPPHDSPVAVSSVPPDSVVSFCTGNFVDGLARPASSTAEAVTILNVE